MKDNNEVHLRTKPIYQLSWLFASQSQNLDHTENQQFSHIIDTEEENTTTKTEVTGDVLQVGD